MSELAFVEKIVELNGKKKKILTLKRETLKIETENEEKDGRIQKMAEDISDDQETYELQVNKCRIKVARRVIESSQLWLDISDFTDPEDDSPIQIPSFITKQMILDLVEMVEKDDMECAHLVLVSLSYLLDFLVALDFLCCDKLKAGVEERIKERITETNWRDVLTLTKDIMGLDNTTGASLEPIFKSVDKYYLENKLDMDKEHKDPWSKEYCGLSAPVFKLGLRSKLLSEETKIHMLRNWVASNYFLMHQAAVFEMLQCLDLKKLLGSISGVTSMVKSWPLSEEQISTFHTMVSKARQPKEEEEKRKRPIDFLQILRERRNRRIVIKLEADQQGPGEGAGGGMLQGVGAELMEADPHLQAHLMIMKPQPDSDNEELEMILEYERMLNAVGSGGLMEGGSSGGRY